MRTLSTSMAMSRCSDRERTGSPTKPALAPSLSVGEIKSYSGSGDYTFAMTEP